MSIELNETLLEKQLKEDRINRQIQALYTSRKYVRRSHPPEFTQTKETLIPPGRVIPRVSALKPIELFSEIFSPTQPSWMRFSEPLSRKYICKMQRENNFAPNASVTLRVLDPVKAKVSPPSRSIYSKPKERKDQAVSGGMKRVKRGVHYPDRMFAFTKGILHIATITPQSPPGRVRPPTTLSMSSSRKNEVTVKQYFRRPKTATFQTVKQIPEYGPWTSDDEKSQML